MKKKLFIACLLFCCFALNSYSQMVGAGIDRQNKSAGTQKGFVSRSEMGVGFSPNSESYYIDWSANIGYQFNPYITLGVGLGLDFIVGSSAIPFYFDVKGFFSNRVINPYYHIKLGYGLNISNNYDYGYNYDVLGGGIYYAFGLGMNYKNFDFGIEMSFMDGGEYDYRYHFSDSYNTYYTYYYYEATFIPLS